jgi:hypothetical protein
VESVVDPVAREHAIAAAEEAQLQPARVCRRAAEAAAVLGKGELDVLRSRHGAQRYAPEPPGLATQDGPGHHAAGLDDTALPAVAAARLGIDLTTLWRKRKRWRPACKLMARLAH